MQYLKEQCRYCLQHKVSENFSPLNLCLVFDFVDQLAMITTASKLIHLPGSPHIMGYGILHASFVTLEFLSPCLL